MRLPTLALLLWVLLTPSHPARAAADEAPAYKEAVSLGLAEFEEKNFLEARALFARAHALYPNARTLRALGMVEYELKNYADCVQLLSQALSSSERPLTDDKREQTEKLRERATTFIARLTLKMDAGTRVSVDGVGMDLVPGSQLVLAVGDHVLEFHATGRIGEKRTLKVKGGEQDTLRVMLSPLNTTDLSPAPADKPKPRRAYKSPWLWTALGLVVAGAATGTVIALTQAGGSTKSELPYTGMSGAPALATPK